MPKRQVHGRVSRQGRGKLTPHQEKSDAGKQASALLAAVADGIASPAKIGNGAPSLILQALDAQSVTPDRVQRLSQRVLGVAEKALEHVGHHLLALQPGDELTTGVKTTTTVAAILIDKWLLIQQQIAHLEGKSSTATVGELNEKAARLLAITQELERRSKAVDITPDPPPSD